MDNPNPIHYSDLISPDSSITDLIAQLDALIGKYTEAQSKIQTQAAQTAKALEGVSGATDDQRKSIALSTEASEKLLAQYKAVDDELMQAKRAQAEANAVNREYTQIAKLVTELNSAKEGSYKQLSAQYRLNKIALNEMSEAERKGTEFGRKLEAESKALYERMNELQKATGMAQLQVGQYERALGGVLGINPRVVSALTDTKKATETLGGVFRALSGPIGVAIGALGAIIAAFKLFKSSIHETQTTGDEFDAAMGEWTGTWEVFKKSVSAVDFSGFITGAREAALAGRNLKLTLDETFERTNSARILRASMSEENAVLQEKMRDQRLTFDERLKAADAYLANMKPIYEQETETARRNADAQLEYLFSVTNRREYASKEEREAAKQSLANYIKEYNINEDKIKDAKWYLSAQKDVAAASEGLRKAETVRMNEYYSQQRSAAQKIVDNASEETKALASIVQQYNLTNDKQVKAYVDAEENYLTAKAAAYNDQKRIVTMRNNLEDRAAKNAQSNAEARQKAAEDAAKAEKKAAEDAIKAKEKADKDAEKKRQKEISDQRAVLNAQLQSIQLQIAVTEQGTQEMLNLRLDMIEKQREIELFENKQKAEHLRQDEKAINAKYDTMVLRETTKFNQEIAKRDLAAAQDLASAEFSLLDRNERQKTIFRLQQEKARLEAILKLDETATEKMTEDEIKAIKATIKRIEKEAGKLPYNNLYELFGLNLDNAQQSALNTAIDSVKDSVDSLVDSWNQAADAAVNAANAQVDSAKKALDAEIEARNAGYANEVETAQKELAAAQRTQDQALREKQKAQNAQLAIDSITQASSLVTASANIWASLSAIPGVGPALAIAAITTMWGSFVAAKVRAAQLTKPTEQYGEGTVELLQGGSHASGHDIDLGTKKDGTRRRAEGGEFFAVINKRNSRRYRDVIPDVINSFNNGTFADRYQRANAAMAGYAVGMIGGSADVSGIEKDVAAIRKQGDESQFVDGRGNVVIKYKNLTRKIKS